MARPRRPVFAFAAVFVAGAATGSLAVYWSLHDGDAPGAARSGEPGPFSPPFASGSDASAFRPELGAGVVPVPTDPSGRPRLPNGATTFFSPPATSLGLSNQDPDAAFERALTLDSRGQREATLQAIVGAWAREDPRAAMARIERLDDSSLRWQLAQIVLQSWSVFDARAAWDYVLGLDEAGLRVLSPERPIPGVSGIQLVAMQLARQDPAAALEASTRLDGPARQQVRRTALVALASQDPSTALSYAGLLENYEERMIFMTNVAGNWAQQDIDGALAWAHGLDPPIASVETTILNVAAVTDPGRALDLALDADPAQREQAVSTVIGMATRNVSDVRALAGSVMTIENSSLRQRALSSLAAAWAMSDPRAAMQWFADNAANVPREAFSLLASSAARTDVAAAAAYAERLPDALRRDWLQQVAGQYAQVDPAGSLVWLRQWQHQPEYTQMLNSAAPILARSDPNAALRLLDESDLTARAKSSLISTIANQWAQTDPPAAARWADGLADDRLRGTVVEQIASSWGSRDGDAALRWIRTMPPDQTRDAALGALLSTMARYRVVDDTLLSAFVSDEMRQRHVVNSLSTVLERDEAEARRLVDRYVTDPVLHLRAQQIIDRGGRPDSF